MTRTAGLALLVALIGASAGAAAEPATGDYVRDAITVATPSWDDRNQPTAACVVWENAEGLGVGPAQLGGLHGLTMTINVKPLPGDSAPPSSFASGLQGLKAAYPAAPAWLFAALERNRAAIERGCGEDHQTPLLIQKLSARDKGA